jgi:hypothetical protein
VTVDQGVLQLTLAWDGKQIVAAGVSSTRPRVASALRGFPVARVLDLVPGLFSLCRCAQGTAARLCVQAARGERPEIALSGGPALAVSLEAIGEHLWRLLLDWPPACGQPARQSEFVTWRKCLKEVADEATAATLGTRLLAWLDNEKPLLFDDGVALEPVALLPHLSAAEWVVHCDGKTFSELPTFTGQPAETGALARRAGDPDVAALLAVGQRVRARLAARLADLRWLAQGLSDLPRLSVLLDAAAVAKGRGLARVETARGTLLHQIQLDGNKVGQYVIIAPTEWNFHPQGAFSRGIGACQAATRGEVAMLARRLALSLDPCVPYELRINDA